MVRSNQCIPDFDDGRETCRFSQPVNYENGTCYRAAIDELPCTYWGGRSREARLVSQEKDKDVDRERERDAEETEHSMRPRGITLATTLSSGRKNIIYKIKTIYVIRQQVQNKPTTYLVTK